MTKKRKMLLKNSFVYFAITAITAGMLFPFLWMISTSLKDSAEMFERAGNLFFTCLP